MTKDATHTYIETVGRRKTSTARVRLFPQAKNSFVINGDHTVESYFKTKELQRVAMAALTHTTLTQKFKVSAVISGGGTSSQAEALRHGIARALIIASPEERKHIKKLGFLKRDARAKERRKFGLKKARKAPQWSKR